MPGAEISNITAWWSSGKLIIGDSDKNPIITVNPSSGGVAFANAGGVTISTGILGGATISGGAVIYGGATISSGVARYGEKVINKTANATLVKGEAGAIITCSTDSVFITLLSAASSGFAGIPYTIRNIATTGQNVIVITATGDSIIGCDISTSNVLKNVSTSHVANDQITLVSGASTTWWLMGMVGTWASTT